MKPWPFLHEPSQLQRGLSAVRIRPCLRGLPTASPHSGHGEIPALRPGTMLVVRPPGVLSPFASTAALPSSREAFKRFLREHYFSFVARTDSCANPVSLFSTSGRPSFEKSLQVVPPLLRVGSSRCYLCESFPGCQAPYSGGTARCTCLFLPLRHRPSPGVYQVGFPRLPAKTTS